MQKFSSELKYNLKNKFVKGTSLTLASDVSGLNINEIGNLVYSLVNRKVNGKEPKEETHGEFFVKLYYFVRMFIRINFRCNDALEILPCRDKSSEKKFVYEQTKRYMIELGKGLVISYISECDTALYDSLKKVIKSREENNHTWFYGELDTIKEHLDCKWLSYRIDGLLHERFNDIIFSYTKSHISDCIREVEGKKIKEVKKFFKKSSKQPELCKSQNAYLILRNLQNVENNNKIILQEANSILENNNDIEQTKIKLNKAYGSLYVYSDEVTKVVNEFWYDAYAYTSGNVVTSKSKKDKKSLEVAREIKNLKGKFEKGLAASVRDFCELKLKAVNNKPEFDLDGLLFSGGEWAANRKNTILRLCRAVYMSHIAKDDTPIYHAIIKIRLEESKKRGGHVTWLGGYYRDLAKISEDLMQCKVKFKLNTGEKDNSGKIEPKIFPIGAFIGSEIEKNLQKCQITKKLIDNLVNKNKELVVFVNKLKDVFTKVINDNERLLNENKNRIEFSEQNCIKISKDLNNIFKNIKELENYRPEILKIFSDLLLQYFNAITRLTKDNKILREKVSELEQKLLEGNVKKSLKTIKNF